MKIPRTRNGALSSSAFIPQLFLLSLTACASLRPGAFKSFETSVATAQKGIETEMARDVDWTREADVDALAETKNAPLSDHMLKEVKGYAWSTPVTVPHWEARLTLRALEELNAAFGGYTTLLVQVAEGHPKESEDRDALAAAITQSLRDAGATIVQVKGRPNLFPAGAAAFSSESLRNVKRSRRAKNLRSAVQENQPWVESYATHCLTLLDLIRTDLKIAYANRMDAIHARWDDKRTPGRNTLARSIFNLNAEYADAMETLNALTLFYNNLPKAHHDLAEGLARNAKPQNALTDLAAFATQVARLTNELEKSR
ncbi:MAG: hypothetical protein IPN90_01390 [Elusimicrobia bacterium]|nr:hypothetical protein [Elusimicrobiota bacterium]